MSQPDDARGPEQPVRPPAAGQGSWGEQVAPPTAPGYGPSAPQAPAGPPQYGQPQYGQPQYGQPQYGQPQYGQPQYGQPQQGQPQHGQPPAGGPQLQKPPPAGGQQPQYGQPQYGPPQYGPPQYGQQPPYGQEQYAAGRYGPSQYGAPSAPGAAPGGYRPPPVQRGIIPLRPIGLGEIYDGAFRSVRANPAVMFGFPAAVLLLTFLVSTFAQWVAMPTIAAWLGPLPDEMDPTGELGSFFTYGASLGIPQLLATPAIGIVSGALTVSVSRSVIGQKIALGELWRSHWKHILLVLVFEVLLSLAVWVVLALLVVVVVAVAQGDVGAAVVVGLLLGVLATVGGVWLTIRLLFVPQAMVLERQGFAAVPRAWRLTRGSFWRVVGISLLTLVIYYVVSQVVAVPFALIATALMPDLESVTSLGYVALTNAGSAVALVIGSVFWSAVASLLYIDLRMRREGLDVELERAAQAAADAAGTTR